MHKWIKAVICLSVLISSGCLIYLFPTVNSDVQYIVFSVICVLLAMSLLTALHPHKLINTAKNSQKINYWVLVVDDNIANRHIISKTLTEYGCGVIEASDGEEALALYQQQKLDTVLMDIEMQVMNGIETVKKIRALETDDKPRTPVIAISAHNDTDKRLQALAAGYDDYLIKPVDENLLIETLEHWQKIIQQTCIAVEDDDKKQKSADIVTDEPQILDDTTKKVVDIKKSLIYSHNNPQLAKEMLQLLITMVSDEKDTMQQHFSKKEWQPLSHLVHKLNGGSCYCGVPELQHHADIIDKALQQHDYELVSNRFHELIRVMDDLLSWAENHELDVIFDTDTV